MADSETTDSVQEPENIKTATTSGTDDAYAPEEPTPDISISLLDIQMPETPESTKGQVSDGDSSRLESPKMVKPVLGKVQAKKRLMAFVNKFNVLPKVQNKPNLSQTLNAAALKAKGKSASNAKSLNSEFSDGKSKTDAESHNRPPGKMKKKTEEKILAIEEIRREESKSKMLLAEAMAAASMDEDSFHRHGQGFFENFRSARERERQEERKSLNKSSNERKYSDRRWQYGKDERGESSNRDGKDRTQDRDRRRDRERRDDRDRREDIRSDLSRNKREDSRSKRENEKDKWDDTKEKKGGVSLKKENLREKRSISREKDVDARDKKEKEVNKYKEKDKELLKCGSWAELKKYGLTSEEIVHIRKRNNIEKSIKNRTAQDYARHFEQMLMSSNHRQKRAAFIADGLNGLKEYPPESVKITKRGRGPHVFYCENPRVSLFLNRQQLLQNATVDHRDKIRDICEAATIRASAEDGVESQEHRNWYPRMDLSQSQHKAGKAEWQLPIIQFPRSKWDSEDEDTLPVDAKPQEGTEEKLDEPMDTNTEQHKDDCTSHCSSDHDNAEDEQETCEDNVNNDSSIKGADNDNARSISPSMQSTGDEKLASEYEQFMKMVCTEIPPSGSSGASKDNSPQKTTTKSASPSSYHEFNIETNLSDDKSFTSLSQKSVSERSHKVSGESVLTEKSVDAGKLEYTENSDGGTVDICSSPRTRASDRVQESIQSESIHEKGQSEESRSIPSDWENVTIKVERLSDENSEPRATKKKKMYVHKKLMSSSDSSSSSSSSDLEEDNRKKRRKRKLSHDSSSSDSESSESSSTSTSESSSSDDKRKKKRKKKKKIGKRKRKVKRASKNKKRRRKVHSSESSSSESDSKRKKRKVMKKKQKEKKLHAKKLSNGDIIKVIQKGPIVPEDSKASRPPKKVKEETQIDSKSRVVEKHAIWDNEELIGVRKLISSDHVSESKNTSQKDEKNSKTDARYLEEWEMGPLIIPQGDDDDVSMKSDIMRISGKLASEDSSLRKGESEERDAKEEQPKDKRLASNEITLIEGKGKIQDDSDGSRKRKRDKEKRNSTEFLADWERESERMTRHILRNSQEDVKSSKKSDKQKKEKWGETEFDTLNVPSLTQLEREVGKRQLLADEWEVDSLEAVPDLIINKRRSGRSGAKKLEKEVKYDKKTDTYISVEKDNTKENRKRQDRLSAIRIWEDEQEEGEREQMMLLQARTKRKKDDWYIEEDSFLNDNHKVKENVSNIVGIPSIVESITTDVPCDSDSTVKDDTDKPTKTSDPVISKKARKSRWDIESHNDEKSEPKTPVMWEEECPVWTTANKFDDRSDKIVLDVPEFVASKSKMKKSDSSLTDEQSSAGKSPPPDNIDIADLFPRKSKDIDLLESSWLMKEVDLDKKVHTQRIDNSLPQDVKLVPKAHQAAEQLQEMLKFDVAAPEKDLELYSPSSPAASQKSEDAESSSGSSTNSSSTKEEDPVLDETKKDCIKKDEESLSDANIPFQLMKFHETTKMHNKPDTTQDQAERISHNQSDEEKRATIFDSDCSNKPPKELSFASSTDARSSKSLGMDIFAEYEPDDHRDKISTNSSDTVSVTETKDGDSHEGKAALKLIPKQLLIRRTNEQIKLKRPSEITLQDPIQHAAALLTIQQKLLRSQTLRNDGNDIKHNEPVDTTTDDFAATELSSSVAEQPPPLLLGTDAKTDIKPAVKPASTTASTNYSRLPSATKVDSDHGEEYKGQKKSKEDDRKSRSSKNESDRQSTRSPIRDQKKRSPGARESDKCYVGDRDREKKEKKPDDREKSDRKGDRVDKGSKVDYNESKRRSSPGSSRGRRRRSGSPSNSWERERSMSVSHSRSWSRSISKSPKRKDESVAANVREKDRRSSKIDEERSYKSRIAEERREKSTRTPPRSTGVTYFRDNYKKHPSTSRSDRDDWNKRKYDSIDQDREKDTRPYNPIEMLRERNIDTERRRESRVHSQEAGDHAFWQFEMDSAVRDGNESVDSYVNGQDIDLEYDERTYYRDESIERDITEGPIRSSSRFKQRKVRLSGRRDRHWEKDRDSSDVDRNGHVRKGEKSPYSRSSRSKRSPARSDRFRRRSRSRSRSWTRSRSRSRSKTRSRSRSRSTSRSRSRLRSRSNSRSRSRSRSISRTRSTSRAKARNAERGSRMSDKLHCSRSPSPSRGRSSARERKDEDDDRDESTCHERGRRIETIVQSVSGMSRGIADSGVMDSDMHLGAGIDMAANFQYSNDGETGNEYYYTENNLTYPPCIDESTTSSPKRLSLDDRLELELGIKKQHGQESSIPADYPPNFNPNIVAYPSPPSQQQMMYRDQPTVLQVGNVLQVVPADFNGVSAMHREVSAAPTPPVVRGSSQVVRVGNVLQVVPTSLDWTGGPQTSSDHSGVLYSAAVPSPSPASVPITVPLPVPVPMPVPAVPSAVTTPTSVSTLSPVPLALPIPVPVPVPVPIPVTTNYQRPEPVPPKVQAQPVYNYEAILETRRKEREERKRLRELRRKEKERRKIERINRRALRLLEKSTLTARPTDAATSQDKRGISPNIERSVIRALREGEESADGDDQGATLERDEEDAQPSSVAAEEEDDAPADEEEDEEEEEEAEAEEEDDDDEEPEDEDEEEVDDEDRTPKVDGRQMDADEDAANAGDASKDQVESESKEWPCLPPAPLKGILVSPGFRLDAMANGTLDDASDSEDNDEDDSDQESVETDPSKEDAESKASKSKGQLRTRSKRSMRSRRRGKKSVQFADGIKPGEGTSPSGGEGDMPSPPPPPATVSRDGVREVRKLSSRKSRKQEKRAKPPKTKKKVKVKIIKLKKPRITPLTAMMMDDSDELDDRSPPPPPPGSPPPPHMWPSYLSAYNTSVTTVVEPPTTIQPASTTLQAPPPPTPLPLLVPPPPLNYTIQPCSKA